MPVTPRSRRSSSPRFERTELDTADTIEHAARYPVEELVNVPCPNRSKCHIYNHELYKHLYRRSLDDSENFWREMASDNLRWIRTFTKVSSHMDLSKGEACWFLNGKLNVCDNCVDRWAERFPNRTAIIWEGDEPGWTRHITYDELHVEVCKMANLLKLIGVRKHDTVGIYLPMIPEAAVAMLACARIGAVHAVTFAGFSAHALAERLEDARAKVLITADVGRRNGKILALQSIAKAAIAETASPPQVVVFQHPGNIERPPLDPAFVDGTTLMEGMRPYCPVETMDSEDLLFVLYTSGSTGKPKGVAHSGAGYLLYAALTHRFVFDYHPGDIYACVADVGWITGHSYVVYGPLCNGATTLMFESVPTYPTPSRYWDIVERCKVNQFYTSPTAIRTLMRFGSAPVREHDTTSLRVLGSVGEPINPEAWRWLFDVVGEGRCSIVDTYWQTETGGVMMTPLPGASVTKPGSAVQPFFGVDPVLLDPLTGAELRGNDVCGALCFKRPWPAMMRTIYGDHKRIETTYMNLYRGYYFTGDGAFRDRDGYYWISGRIDDTINVAGHRFGTAEIEGALVGHPSVAEAAVVPVPDDLKGLGIFCLAILRKGHEESAALISDLKGAVRSAIGPIATPDYVVFVPALPKTRSGKIMRRILRKLASGGDVGDVSTLAEPDVVLQVRERIEAALGR